MDVIVPMWGGWNGMIVVKAEVLMSVLMLSVGDSFIQIFENLKISQAARLWMTFSGKGRIL